MSARQILTGWGGTAPSAATVARPASPDEAAALVAALPQRGGIGRGLGRAYGDAAQNAGGVVAELLDLVACDLDPATGVARCGAGLSIDALLAVAVPQGWFVPVSPGTRQVTVGGAVAADIHGKNHHVDGSLAHHVLELTLATPTGVVTTSPTRDPELHWATLGGMGLTGVVLDATLQLVAIPSSRLRVDVRRCPDLDALLGELRAGQAEHRYSVGWIDLSPRGRGRGVVTQGDFATPEELPARHRGAPFAYGTPPALPAPPLPSGTLNAASISAFNELWFRRHPRSATVVQGLGSYFHPLDLVDRWNRAYGRRGFVQWQCVVPLSAEEALRDVVDRLQRDRVPSFLAVLKTFGERTAGPLSFPRPGWTLALDIPTGVPGLSRTLDDLDELVVAEGGRIYLAKDSRLRPELVPAMYPRLDEWRAVCDRVDPERRMVSDLARRLHLRDGLPA